LIHGPKIHPPGFRWISRKYPSKAEFEVQIHGYSWISRQSIGYILDVSNPLAGFRNAPIQAQFSEGIGGEVDLI
jgi:hypothetical protein